MYVWQTNALESELRSARDVVRLRADMDLERLRAETEWQRRLSAEEVCMYDYMCVCVCTYTYVCVCVCVKTCVHHACVYHEHRHRFMGIQ
jgi:hypothetical protein